MAKFDPQHAVVPDTNFGPASGVLSDGWVQSFGVAFVLTSIALVAAIIFDTEVKAAALAFASAAIPFAVCLLIHRKETRSRVILLVVVVLCCVGIAYFVWTRVRLSDDASKSVSLPAKYAPPKAPEIEHRRPTPAPTPAPAIVIVPSYGNLKQRCKDMAATILNYASRREGLLKTFPSIKSSEKTYNGWEQGNGEHLSDQYLSDLTTLRDDLAKHDIKDLQLDSVIRAMQLIETSERHRELNDHYLMSLEDLKGIAGLLMKISDEIPPA